MTTLLFLCDGLEQNIVTILKTLYCEPVVKVLEMGQYSSVLLPPYCYLKQPSSIGKSLGSWNKCVTLLLERKVFRRFRIIFGMARRKLRQSYVLAIFLGPSTLHGRLGGNYYLPIIAFDGDLMVGLIIKTQRTSKVDTFNGDYL